MSAFSRTDTSILGRWWWTIDRWMIAAVTLLILVGLVLILAASPSVAEKLKYPTYHFVQRQLAFLPIAILVMVTSSMMSPKGIRRTAIILFSISLFLTVLTYFFGIEIKGAQRWIGFSGFSIQPSEFIKPSFVVVSAWLFAMPKWSKYNIGHLVCITLYIFVAVTLLLQPDLGMAIVVSTVWCVQFFIAGLPLIWVMVFLLTGIGGTVGAYLLLPHVSSRIDRFIDPSAGDTFQISRSLQAFGNGGVFGQGPGEGSVKSVLPDAHTDFIFAVAGEEFGLIACLIIVGLFAFVVLRGLACALREDNLFILLAVSGLLTQFGLQAFVNMGSTLHLIPTKGMTLPFISYGGSSLVGVALCMGMVLALTRRRYGARGLA